MRTVQAILHSYYTGIHVPGSSYPFSFCYTNIPHIPNSVFFLVYTSWHGFEFHFHTLEILCIVYAVKFIYKLFM